MEKIVPAKTIINATKIATPAQKRLITKAYNIAEEAHRPQKRRSGEPYFVHVSAVAHILAEIGMDTETVIAGLLHDVVEDTPITLPEIEQQFGAIIKQLVDGVTKIDDKTSNNQKMTEAQYLQKTVRAMTNDVRVIVIKLCDRLHNMRTLGALKPHRQKEISQETLQLFTPLAAQLGMWELKSELEQLCLQYINPIAHKELTERVKQQNTQYNTHFTHIMDQLTAVFNTANLPLTIRPHKRNLYSLYKDEYQKDTTFSEGAYPFTLHILVETIPQCYEAMGIIHQAFRPLQGMMMDYIALPKDTFYQSLHTSIETPELEQLRIQIRTYEMDYYARLGLAGYWQNQHHNSEIREQLDQRLQHLRDMIQPAEEADSPEKYLESVIHDIDENRIYTKTPRGDYHDLPRGSTPIDFAYRIHTEVGDRCRGARVNGKVVPLDYQLQSGDVVDIYTITQGGPNLDWLDESLNYVHTNRAKTAIRNWFRKREKQENIYEGRKALDNKLKQLNVSDQEETYVNNYKHPAYDNHDDLLEAIGGGKITASEIVTNAIENANVNPSRPAAPDNVPLVGVRGYTPKLARCCKPQVGDDIVGYITRNTKLSIHRQDCSVLNQRPADSIQERLLSVEWSTGTEAKVLVIPVELSTQNRTGIMGEVGMAIAKENVNMSDVHITTQNANAKFYIELEVDTFATLSRVLTKLASIDGVNKAQRMTTESQNGK